MSGSGRPKQAKKGHRSKAHSNENLRTCFSSLKLSKYWHKLPQEVAVSFFFSSFFLKKFLLIKAEWVICFNQVQVIRLNMGITQKYMMAYGMQKAEQMI